MPFDKSREVRFGLVMYGGVSLAIYINGVTYEFSRLARGNGVYKLIKWLTDSELIVDIISGTSAGGVNGIFLSYALANGRDFSAMGRLWREFADIENLLRKPDARLDESTSLLDGENYYHPALKKALEDLPRYRGFADEPSPSEEFDLFITGTDLEGNVYTVLDDQGHAIDVKDHRRFFWLKRRPYRATFEPSEDTHEALAKLARISSCFPAAFAPVEVSNDTDGNAAVAKLREWGKLDGKQKTYFLDGGVLDNKPFSHTIRAISTHPTQAPVERILCYVEPDPDRFPGGATPREPNFFTAAMDGSFGIPNYQSIAEDLNLITEHNSRVNRYWQVCIHLRKKLETAPGEPLPTGVRIPTNIPLSQQMLYARSRLAMLRLRALRGLATKSGTRVRLNPEERDCIEKCVKDLIDMPPESSGQGHRDILTDAQSLEWLDVYFRLRRLHHVVYRLAEECGKHHEEPPAAWFDLWKQLNRHIQILEIIQYWMEYLLDNLMEEDDQNHWSKKTPDKILSDLRRYLEEFLHLAPDQAFQLPASPDALGQFHTDLGTKARRVCARTGRNPVFIDDFGGGLLKATDDAEKQLFGDGALETFRSEYTNFVALDALVYPLQFVSDLTGTKTIKTLRISPVDARSGFSNRCLEDKLGGDTLAHFGGFFKRSWRSNDILWGRLDAINELVKATVTPERLRDIMKSPYLRGKVQGRFLNADCIGSVFPRSSHNSADQLFQLIQQLLNLNLDTSRTEFDRTVSKISEALIEMAQVEVLVEDLPAVIADATLEQAKWNRFCVRSEEVSDEEILPKARALPWPDAVDLNGEVAQCRLLADWTRQDPYRMDVLWRGLEPSDARLAWWDTQAPNDSCTNGQQTIAEAIRLSYRELARLPEDFVPARGMIDPQVAAIAADGYARSMVAEWTENPPARTPAESKVAVFFTQRYRIGPKDLAQAIPTLVLIGIFTRSLLVVRNCILGALHEETRRAITRSWLFRLGLEWPLRMVHWMAWLWRREPVWLSVSQAVAFAVSVITLVLTGMGRDSLLWDNSGIILKRWLLLVLLPLGVLIYQFRLAKKKPRRRVVMLVAAGATLVALAWAWDLIPQLLHLPTLAKAVAAGFEAFRRAL
jgi:patatin-related protein